MTQALEKTRSKTKGAANPEGDAPNRSPDWPDAGSARASADRVAARFPAIAAAENAADSLAEMQAEVAGFVAQRVHAAVTAQSELLGCRTLPEMQQVQMRYLREMAEDYTAQWREVMNRTLRLSGTGQGRALAHYMTDKPCNSIPV